jgi:SAM-dependent methyltransferase
VTSDLHSAGPARLNWGCGDWVEPGWVNSDIKAGPGVVGGDVRDRLPFDDESFDYVVSIHALPELPLGDLVPSLRELGRLLRPHGVLRLGLPDFDRAIRAYVEGDHEYFLIPDNEERTLGGKLITQVLWYGYSRSLFTYDFTEDLLHRAGFHNVRRCTYRETTSRFPEIVALDNREDESLFVEGDR